MITIKDYFEPLMMDDTEEVTGIFSALENVVKSLSTPDEILTKIFDGKGSVLDMDYVYTHAYSKWCAFILERLTEIVKAQQPSISDSRTKVLVLGTQIAPLLLNRFSEIWKKKYVAITADYTPTNDYKENEKVDYSSHGVDTPQTTTTSKTSTDTTQSTSVTQNANTYALIVQVRLLPLSTQVTKVSIVQVLLIKTILRLPQVEPIQVMSTALTQSLERVNTAQPTIVY